MTRKTEGRQNRLKLDKRIKALKAVGEAVEAARKRGLKTSVKLVLKKYIKKIPVTGTRWLYQLKDLINNLK
jgi:hypothetical protein